MSVALRETSPVKGESSPACTGMSAEGRTSWRHTTVADWNSERMSDPKLRSPDVVLYSMVTGLLVNTATGTKSTPLVNTLEPTTTENDPVENLGLLVGTDSTPLEMAPRTVSDRITRG